MTNDMKIDILNFALAEAMTEKLRIATLIKKSVDAGYMQSKFYKEAVHAFSIACAEVRILRAAL